MHRNRRGISARQYHAEDFFKAASAANFALSPDGKRIAYLAADGQGLGLFVRELRGEKVHGPTRRLADPRRHTVLDFVWKDDTHLLMSCDRQGSENYHIYYVDVHADAEPVDLTPAENTHSVIVSVLKDTPSSVLVAHNQRTVHLLDVYRVDVSTGASTLLALNPGNVVSWFADADGNVRLAQSSGDAAGLHYRNDPGGEFRQIATLRFDEIVIPIAFVPGMPDHAYVLSNRHRDTLALYQFDLEAGVESRYVYGRNDVDLGGVLWSDVRQEILGVTWIDTRLRCEFFDPERHRMQIALEAALPDHQIVVKGGSADESLFVVAAASDRSPEHHYLYCRSGNRLVSLGSTLPHLRPDDMASMEPVRFAAHDGLTIHGYLSRPAPLLQRPISMPSLIVFPHGGPWARDVWGFNRIVQWLANQGFAVLQINFRGSTGYGKHFWRAGFRQWGNGIQRDIEAAVQWAVEKGVAPLNRIGIFGFSFGGYSALMQIARNPALYRCAVDYAGPTNLPSFLQSIPTTWEPMREALYEMIGDARDEKGKAELDRASPLYCVDDIRTPLLVAHGANDPRVSVSESEQIAFEVKKRGAPVELFVCADEGHGFTHPHNQIDFYEHAERFFRKWFGP
ncbi:LpqB family beta-propeller domain-containing protein [Paraburkholderia graminis]|uniref:alpha/beta hydrolase family protein n=1 Tax=Paraburkholderia graminis TaxID=60548 RepID=UPI003C9E6F76